LMWGPGTKIQVPDTPDPVPIARLLQNKRGTWIMVDKEPSVRRWYRLADLP
jgi:hypothetical protein